MKANRAKPYWSSWSDKLEDGCSYSPDFADDVEAEWAKEDTARHKRRLDTEMLAKLNAEADEDDTFRQKAEFLARIIRHLDMVPNHDHQAAVRLWMLKDINLSPVFGSGVLPAGETLRGTGEWLLAAGVAVRNPDGSLAKRNEGYLPGQIYPEQVKGYIKKGLGFCLATELWVTDADDPDFGKVRVLGWDDLLKRCEQYVQDELRSKNSFTKRRRL